MRRSRGFTVYELLVSLVLIGLLGGIAAGVMRSMSRDDQAAAGYATDLARVRQASNLLAAAVRSARSLDVGDQPDGIVIDGELWTVRGDSLMRGERPVVDGVSRLDVTRDGLGLVTIAVAPVPRRNGARAPSLVRTVRRRLPLETAR